MTTRTSHVVSSFEIDDLLVKAQVLGEGTRHETEIERLVQMRGWAVCVARRVSGGERWATIFMPDQLVRSDPDTILNRIKGAVSWIEQSDVPQHFIIGADACPTCGKLKGTER